MGKTKKTYHLFFCMVWASIGFGNPAFSLPLCPDKKTPALWDKCFGEYTADDGSNYTGEWVKGKFSGWGTFTPKVGASLEGLWEAGKFLENGEAPLFNIPKPVARVAPQKAGIVNKKPLGVALIIGNKTYAKGIPSVKYAHRDARAMRTYIQTQLGYKPENTLYLQDATKAMMEAALGSHHHHEGELWRHLSPDHQNNIVVYYSGHGVPGLKDYNSYLLPVDADPEIPEINGYSIKLLQKNLQRYKAASTLIILDACFSGRSDGGHLISNASGLTIVPKMPKEADNVFMITAARNDQVASWDNKARHGLFTHYLLEALYGKADLNTGGNRDGTITFGETESYLANKMTRAARRTFGRHQNATFSGNPGFIMIKHTPGRYPKRPILPGMINQGLNAEKNSQPQQKHNIKEILDMDEQRFAIKRANVRKKPDPASKLIGKLPIGREINVTGKLKDKNWYRVSLPSGHTGYVFGKLISSGGAQNTARANTMPPRQLGHMGKNYKIVLKNFTDFRLDRKFRQRLVNKISKTFQESAAMIDSIEAQISNVGVRKEANPEALGKEIFAAFTNSLLGVDLTKNIAKDITIFSGEVNVLAHMKNGQVFAEASKVELYNYKKSVNHRKSVLKALNKSLLNSLLRMTVTLSGGTPPPYTRHETIGKKKVAKATPDEN